MHARRLDTPLTMMAMMANINRRLLVPTLAVSFFVVLVMVVHDVLGEQPQKSLGSPGEWQKDITFIHIGKTGGSTDRCILDHPLRENYCRNDPFFDEELGEGDTAIRRKVVALCHMNHCGPKVSFPHPPSVPLFPIKLHHDVIVSVRNPVERLISWYLYESRTTKLTGEWAKLKHCYPTFDKMVTDGLSIEKANSTETRECQTQAVKCVSGKVQCNYHNFYNYQYYLAAILNPNLPTPKVFVIRNEYKWQDIERINLMLGGAPKSFTADLIFPSNSTIRQSPEGGRNMTREGALQLCRILCTEFQFYTRILSLAENLHSIHIKQALIDLGETCGMSIVDLCPKIA